MQPSFSLRHEEGSHGHANEKEPRVSPSEVAGGGAQPRATPDTAVIDEGLAVQGDGGVARLLGPGDGSL